MELNMIRLDDENNWPDSTSTFVVIVFLALFVRLSLMAIRRSTLAASAWLMAAPTHLTPNDVQL
jgi:hypothetical protein